MISQTCDLIIKQEVGRHSRMYGRRGGELSDLAQEAYIATLRCVDHTNQMSYIRTAIRNQLLDYMRQNKPRTVQLTDDIIDRRATTFHPEQFLSELSEDARFIINLIIDPDPNFWRPAIIHSQRETWLKFLANKLREFNWSVDRITNAFSMIRSALV